VAGEVIILYSDEIQKCCSSPNVTRVIKSNRTRRAGEVARMVIRAKYV
jgi:hypothetical protein